MSPRHRARAILATALVTWAPFAAAGCSPRPTPCAGPTCADGLECLANRCVPQGRDPVAASTERVVRSPKRIAVVTRDDQGSVDPGLPPTLTLGNAATGAVTLLLDFGDEWKDAGEVESAFVLLEPVPESAAGDDVDVAAWRIDEPWDETGVRWATQPKLGVPRATGIARSSPPVVLRIDVTAIARFLRERAEDHGIALTAASTAGHGASYWTGAGRGRGPRLELYLRQ